MIGLLIESEIKNMCTLSSSYRPVLLPLGHTGTRTIHYTLKRCIAETTRPNPRPTIPTLAGYSTQMPIRPNFGPRAHSHSSPPTHWLRGAVESAGAAAAARLVGSPPPPPLSRWRMSSRRAATSASQRGKGTPLENSRNRRSHECEWYTSPQNRSSRPKPSSRERASSDRAGTSSDAS